MRGLWALAIAGLVLASCTGDDGSEGVLLFGLEGTSGSSSRLVALEADATQLRSLIDDMGFPGLVREWEVAPSGATVLVGRDTLIDAQAGATLPLYALDRVENVEDVAWSNDSRFIAVRRSLPSEEVIARSAVGESGNLAELFIVPADGGEAHQLRPAEAWEPGNGLILPPLLTWSADDELIAFGYPARVIRVDGGTEVEPPLTAAYQARGEFVSLTGVVADARDDDLLAVYWSPDGGSALQWFEYGGMVIGPTDGSAVKVLGLGMPGGWTQGDVWSPDGSYVAFDGSDPISPSHAALVVVDADGSHWRTVWTAAAPAEAGMFGLPPVCWAWSPGSDAIAVLDIQAGAITITPIAEDDAVEVRRIDIPGGKLQCPVAWRAASVGGSVIALTPSVTMVTISPRVASTDVNWQTRLAILRADDLVITVGARTIRPPRGVEATVTEPSSTGQVVIGATWIDEGTVIRVTITVGLDASAWWVDGIWVSATDPNDGMSSARFAGPTERTPLETPFTADLSLTSALEDGAPVGTIGLVGLTFEPLDPAP
jgi:hypothetical protein